LESELIAMQDLETAERLQERPHKTPRESRQSMSDYATTLWQCCDHRQGEESFKRNGLNNCLKGKEDVRITRTAAEFWRELNMPGVRSHLEVEVDLFLADRKNPRPEDFRELLQSYDHCPDGDGERLEGQEIELAAAPGETVCLGNSEEASASDTSEEEPAKPQVEICDAPTGDGDMPPEAAHEEDSLVRSEGPEGGGFRFHDVFQLAPVLLHIRTDIF